MATPSPLLLTLGHWLVRHRWLVMGTVAAAMLAIGLALPRLRVGFGVDSFFRSSDPELQQALAHYRKGGFEPPDNLLLFGWSEPDPFAATTLERLQRFEQEARRHAVVHTVTTLASARTPGSLRADARATAASSTWRDLLVSRDGDAVGGVIVLHRSDDFAALAKLFSDLRALLAGEGRTLNLCGLPHHRVETRALVRADMARFLPIGTAVSAVFLFWLVPHWALAALALAIAPLVLIATLGTMAFLDVGMTMLTSTLPTLLLCMSIADGVHMVGRFLEERAKGHSPRDASALTFAALFVPCLMTSLTTCVGFLTLCTADLIDPRQLGGFAALGMAYAFVVTMTTLPAAMSFVSSAPGRRPADPASYVVRVALWAQRWRPRVWIGIGTVVLAVSSVLCTDLRADHRMTADLWPSSPQMQQMAFYEQHFVGVVPAELVVEAKQGFGAAERDQLQRLRQQIEREPGVSRSLSIADLYTDGLPPLLVQGSAAAGALPAGLLSADGHTARMLVFRGDLGTAAWNRFAADVREIAAGLPDLVVRLAGLQMVGSEQVLRLTNDLVRSFFGSIVLILVLVWLQCRSLRLSIVSMTVCLVPLVAVLASMTVLGVALRPLVMIAFCVAFGLMIDDAIHLVARWQEELRSGRRGADAVFATLATAGRPVSVTTLLLLVGFVTILGSDFRGTFAFGLLVVLSLTGALLSALLLLPALLRGLWSGPR